MDERLRFVARLLEGEKMAVLCREFDISRKTGYKIVTVRSCSSGHRVMASGCSPLRHNLGRVSNRGQAT